MKRRSFLAAFAGAIASTKASGLILPSKNIVLPMSVADTIPDDAAPKIILEAVNDQILLGYPVVARRVNVLNHMLFKPEVLELSQSLKEANKSISAVSILAEFKYTVEILCDFDESLLALVDREERLFNVRFNTGTMALTGICLSQYVPVFKNHSMQLVIQPTQEPILDVGNFTYETTSWQ